MKIICLFIILISMPVFSAQLAIINSLGASGKGQFLALEEYQVSIDGKELTYELKFFNTWKNQYIRDGFKAKAEYLGEDSIKKLRQDALANTQDSFKKLGINNI